MALGRGDEADRAVTVLVVVPLDQRGGPSPGGRDIRERGQRIRRTILERFGAPCKGAISQWGSDPPGNCCSSR